MSPYAQFVMWKAVFLLAFLFAGLLAAAVTANIRFGLADTPAFSELRPPAILVPGVGALYEPGAETRREIGPDRFVVQRVNRLGFLDREPVDRRRAIASCHVAAFGGGFVEASGVPIPDKFHVRLEELAARDLPGFDVTTSAWGMLRTGQIGQLPYYDVYARPLEPDLLVLVFGPSAFRLNTPLARALRRNGTEAGVDPDLLPQVTAVRAEDGTMTLRPPAAASARIEDLIMEAPPLPLGRVWARLLGAPAPPLPASYLDRRQEEWISRLNRRAHYAWILDGIAGAREWRLRRKDPRASGGPRFLRRHPPRVREYVLDFTAFALDEFKKRADRDGAALVILARHEIRLRSNGRFKTLSTMAAERGIPVIDQFDYLAHPRGGPREARFGTGAGGSSAARHHSWAAEALLEWLARHPRVCGASSPPEAFAARGVPPPPANPCSSPGVTAAARSSGFGRRFDVCVDGRQLFYFRDGCAARDAAARFFLHVYPEDVKDLSRQHRQHGFYNRDFAFLDHGANFDGKCLAVVPLPGYEIARVATGEMLRTGPGASWRATVRLRRRSRSTRVRSGFRGPCRLPFGSGGHGELRLP